MTVQRLLWMMEYVTAMAGGPVHELGFYYATDLPEDSPFFDLAREHAGVERGHDLVLRWFPVDALADLPLFPEFLRTAVRRVPGSPQHIVQVDIDVRPEVRGGVAGDYRGAIERISRGSA